MIGYLLKKIFGTKNNREIKRITKIVKKINDLDPEYSKYSDEELKNKTNIFKQRLSEGETLDDILVEVFATVREASKRVLGLRHYDVQLIGGIALHEGKIAEMKTGEGKTLVATAPVYLNALTGNGVHLITVNDYLAKRDSETMGRLYKFLGLTCGVILNSMSTSQKKAAYQSDITYGTNSEFGFDYLRDNMVSSLDEKVQKKLNFCIVDEVDSILIDEARTPLIISGASADTVKWYKVAFQVVSQLVRSRETEKIKDKKEIDPKDPIWKDYEVDEKSRNIVLTEKGVAKSEFLLKVDNLYSPENVELTHYINQALKAKELFKRDIDYLLKDGKVVIIDEFTGRTMEGRRYSDGLHQAIEAKEGVNIAGENQTLATITLQNYFRMYEKLSGMTGTAATEASEFMHTYGLEVLVIPTNKPVIRNDHSDLVYKSKAGKIKKIIEKIIDLHKKGQPVLVGTISIKDSEELSSFLKKAGITHNVLNAKYHEKEAEIVSQAGRLKAVTIATNMAGRGTDIMLGGNPEFLTLLDIPDMEDPDYKTLLEKNKIRCGIEREQVTELGGLFILGTERHESRRIDNQLRGRAGRQGDPGDSEFYLSVEDDLMRISGSDRAKQIMDRLDFPDDEPITHRIINNAIRGAQKQIEARNFGVRKSLLEFDDVMNKQRTAVYESRNNALAKDDLKESIVSMLKDVVFTKISEYFVGDHKDDYNIEELAVFLRESYGYQIEDLEDYKKYSIEEYSQKIYDDLMVLYEAKEENLTSSLMRKLEKYILFETVDTKWRQHLKDLDGLREGIYLRAYGQRDPVIEYKIISGDLYESMLQAIKEQATSFLFKVVLKKPEEEKVKIKAERMNRISYASSEGVKNEGKPEQDKQKSSKAPKRNEECSCGSGKKYKHCCGR